MEKTEKKLCVSLVPIFNHLDYGEQEKIAGASKSRTFNSKELVFRAGDPSEHLYIVHRGKVKIYNLSEDGKEHLIRILEPGDFMGELAIFTDEWLTSYAETMEKTEICSIHKADLKKLLEANPAISFKLLAENSKRLMQAERTIEQFGSQDVEKRLASYLIELADEQPAVSKSSIITLPMSKKDLASYLGSTSETISRRLASFEARQLIEQTGQRKIKILQLDALERLVD
ncbi:cAMP-dependent protein kinase regulatory subunit [Lentibacillus sp. JNUCC-1]|uniref:Crp/Fnr family transcriptional regulator n=1 Tax=Lentibacillus sp. JNUCC-1 TaxID=2654513 RepID=UPI00132A7759|nr:Crp/Fnr family transcriptional regulator [Lentibacillus sp. JNUCC-1]MUV38232.1 cAMP-dependent protein kinase regulatory subunit [Lentibacillus sp. JNUCC-1]